MRHPLFDRGGGGRRHVPRAQSYGPIFIACMLKWTVSAYVRISRRFVVRELSAWEQLMRQSLSYEVHGCREGVSCTAET